MYRNSLEEALEREIQQIIDQPDNHIIDSNIITTKRTRNSDNANSTNSRPAGNSSE